MSKLRLSTTLNLLPREEGKLCENIRNVTAFAKELGFDALDFPFYNPSYCADGFEEYVECAIEAAEKNDIKFEVCHLPFNGKIALDPSLLPEFEKKVYNGIKGAKMLGAKYAVIHPNTTTLDRIKYDENAIYESVISHLAPFVETAAREGVNLIVENMRPVPKLIPTHRYCAEAEELCRVADKLGIGICWDFGHANIAGLTQSRALEYIGSRLKLLHVDDNLGIDDNHLPPFYGTVDWKDAMHGLALAGYNGLFNYELNTAKIPAAARRAFAVQMVDMAEELQTYIK